MPLPPTYKFCPIHALIELYTKFGSDPFPGMKQILGRRDGVLGALLSKVKSNFLCSIRPISQNVAALDFSKLL